MFTTMKNLFETSELINSNDQTSMNFSEQEVLSPKEMNHIRGGDGEDNGGGNIIIIPTLK